MVANITKMTNGSIALGTTPVHVVKFRFFKFANCHPILFLIVSSALKRIFKETVSNWILITHSNSMLIQETNTSTFYVVDYSMMTKSYSSCAITKNLIFIAVYRVAGFQC
ncbi:hypothetical protein APS65_02830 [Bifidobacterium longum]|nr:hypothetical protein APS65_02830 [Bifidobacterium longum]